jgi:hypothetical protein
VFAESTAAFFADFGVPAVFGDSVSVVLLDQPEENILGDRVQTTKYQITFRTADLPGLKHGSWIQVDDKQFSVINVRPIDDGVFSAADLKTP